MEKLVRTEHEKNVQFEGVSLNVIIVIASIQIFPIIMIDKSQNNDE